MPAIDALKAQAASVEQHLQAVLQAIKDQLPEADSDLSRSWYRFLTALTRGGAAGLTVRGGLHLLSSLIWLVRNPKKHLRPGDELAKRALTPRAMVNDTLRYTLFLAALGGSYVAVEEGIAILGGRERTARWRALVAGAVAGQTMLLTGSHVRHHSLATYVLLRGVTLLVRCGNKRPAPGTQLRGGRAVLRWLLAPTRLQHGDVVLMCAAAAQIIYSFIMMPNTLPPTYIRFLSKQTAKPSFVWRAVREQALRNWQQQSPGRLQHLHGTPWHQCSDKTPCEFWHPGQSCTGHAVGILPQSYLRSLGVYIPVYLVPAILVHRQKLLKDPLPILPKIAMGIARSSLFLTSFIALAFGGACLGFTATGTSTGPVIGTFTAVGGLATLLEKKSRRMELALYCASRALESFARCLGEWKVVPASLLPARLDVLLFSAGCAAIMHCYSDARGQHRDVFRSKYLSVLDAVFGNTGVQEGAITHQPSNKDLITSVSRKFHSMSSNRLDSLAAGLHRYEGLAAGTSQDGGKPGPSRLHHGGSSTPDNHLPTRSTTQGALSASASLPAFQSMHAALLASATPHQGQGDPVLRTPAPAAAPVSAEPVQRHRAGVEQEGDGMEPRVPSPVHRERRHRPVHSPVVTPSAFVAGNGPLALHNQAQPSTPTAQPPQRVLQMLPLAAAAEQVPGAALPDIEAPDTPAHASVPGAATPLTNSVHGSSAAVSHALAGMQQPRGATQSVRVHKLDLWDRTATHPPAFGSGRHRHHPRASDSCVPGAADSSAHGGHAASSTFSAISGAWAGQAGSAPTTWAQGASLLAARGHSQPGTEADEAAGAGQLSEARSGGSDESHASGGPDQSVRGGRLRGIGGMRGMGGPGMRRIATAPCFALLAQQDLTLPTFPTLDPLPPTPDTKGAFTNSLDAALAQSGGLHAHLELRVSCVHSAERSASEGRVHGSPVHHGAAHSVRHSGNPLADECVRGAGAAVTLPKPCQQTPVRDQERSC